ncbi:ATP-binding protein [Janthinobacterium sp. PC23-8]|uniref:ATP-binding protein n=1 Tax=Janthinobacterium sp. PC23-8 TaxID=2012679 RepID=UPI000B9622F3|nr:ATP-binding protein [Janthinobacterium sp. PC23-8]OYO27922.1 hypothetical protein CD932_22705 [Janthinobacterium sp. PC23-8]
MSGVAELLIVLRNEITQIDTMAEAVDDFCTQNGLPAKAAFNLNLVLEEVVVNVINYAFPGGASEPIYVRIRLEDAIISAEVRDTGVAFDPLVAGPPDMALDLEKRVVGGLGVHFLKTLMDDVSYRRHEGQNYLRFSKQLF